MQSFFIFYSSVYGNDLQVVEEARSSFHDKFLGVIDSSEKRYLYSWLNEIDSRVLQRYFVAT